MIQVSKSKMSASRLTTTLRNEDRTQTKRPSRRPPQDGNSVQNPFHSRNGNPVTLFVRTPAQKTVQVQIDANLVDCATKLQQIICDQIGYSEQFSQNFAVFTHHGKILDFGRSSLGSNLQNETSQDVSKYHLTTIQVSMVLPGGSMIDKEAKSQLFDENLATSDYWSGLSDTEKGEYLQKKNTESQVKLWTQIDSEEDKANFLNFFDDQKMKNQFWSSMSHQLQAEALRLLSVAQATDLLGSLDQENLCLTISMHLDQVRIKGKTLMELLTDDEKKQAVNIFISCGKASVTDSTGGQFIEKLNDGQYEGFSSIPNLKPDYSYVQVIENPRITDSMIVLADVTNDLKLHHDASDDDSLHRHQNDEKAQDIDNLPRFLSPTSVGEEGEHHYKEWKMEQINPDPILNKDNKSVIASFEALESEKGFWCKESFTITNRMSKLYKGQSGDTYIFSRERPPTKETEPEKGHEEEENEKEEGKFDEPEEVESPNHIQLHLINFIISDLHYDLDMKKVKKIEDAVEKQFEMMIDTDLSDAIRNEIIGQYDNFVEKANDEQKIKTIIDHKSGFLRQNYWNDFSGWIDQRKGKIQGLMKSTDDGDQVLDREEFKEFYNKNFMTWLSEQCGSYVDDRDRCNQLYDILSQLSPQVDGICQNDIFVYYFKFWFPTTLRHLIQDNAKESTHETFKILEDSHLGQELTKSKQVKKEEESRYMDLAPNMIKIEGKLFLAYTFATEGVGPSLFFYDLQNGRTCARISKADLLIDCYPHTDDGVTKTHIRYIENETVFVRSIDFNQILSGEDSPDQPIFDFAAEENQNVVNQFKITSSGSARNRWSERYINEANTTEVFVNVSQDEDKEKCHQSFQLMFTKREHSKAGNWNWCVCFQTKIANDKTVSFKNLNDYGSAEQFVTKRQVERKGAKKIKDKTLIQCHAKNTDQRCRTKDLWFYEVEQTEEELRTKDHFSIDFVPDIVSHILAYDIDMKFESPVIARNGKFRGLHCSKQGNQLSQFNHTQEDKEESKREKVFQEKKLWKNMFVSYPFLYYTGLTPECREIIIVNLADTSQPQKIIQLPEGLQLMNFVRSHLDDRIYFQAYIRHGGTKGLYEILQRQPFKKNEDFQSHEISIRILYEDHHVQEIHVEGFLLASSRDFICNSQSPSGKLFKTIQFDDELHIAGKGNVVASGNEFLLDLQRSSQNNLYWLEHSPLLGTLLRGVFNIRNIDERTDKQQIREEGEKTHQSTLLNSYRMGDTDCLSIIAESKLVGEKQSEVISVLDKDLNLHTFTVNFEERSFKPLLEVRNLHEELEIDTEWLQFNKKPQIDYESYKRDYKLFSSDTLGVVLKEQDFIVYYDINSNSFSMVDTAHDKFPVSSTESQNKKAVNWTKNCEGSDFRLMDCTLESSDEHKAQNFIVVYPAPESRKLDLYGFYGRRNNVSTHFISENLFLAQFHYRDVFQNFSGQGSLKLEESYWSVLDQTGRIKSLSVQLDKDSKVVFSKQTKTGSMVILNSQKTTYQILKFNLKGELVHENVFDDGEIFQKSFEMVQNKLNLQSQTSKKTKSQQNKQDEFKLTNIFLEQSQGTLFRLASLVLTQGKEPNPQKTECFSLGGAIEIPISECSAQENLTGLTILVFICKSDEEEQQFQEAVFHIAQNSLCYFSPRFADKSIRIISLEQVEKEKKLIRSKTQTFQDNTFGNNSDTSLSQYQREEQKRDSILRIRKDIDQKSYRVNASKSQEVLPVDQSLLARNDSQLQSDFTWIDFDTKSLSKDIDLSKSIKLDQKTSEYGLKLNSLDSTIKRLNLKLIENDLLPNGQDQQHNYLQVSLPDRVIIYDISFTPPKESFSCFKMNFFFDPQNFVDLELPTIWSLQKTKKESAKWRQVTACHQKNVFLAKDFKCGNEKKQEKFVSLIKTYSISDAQGLIWLQEKLDKKVLPTMISPIQPTSFESTMVSYRGHNVFSIFSPSNPEQEKKFKLILEFMRDDLFRRKETQKSRMKSLNRRIQKILTMPVPKFASKKTTEANISQKQSSSQSKTGQEDIIQVDEEQEESSGQTGQEADFKTDGLASSFITALEKSIYFDVVLRDLFIELSQDSTEYILSDLAFDQTQMQQILENYSPTLDEFLVRQVAPTPFTEKIIKVNWPKKAKKYITFRQSDQQLDTAQVQKQVDEQLNKNKNTFEAPITVRMLRTKWLVQRKQNFSLFSKVLQQCSSESVYDTEFMKVLVQGYWPQTSKIVILRCFLPWILYLMCTIFLFARILRPDEVEIYRDSIYRDQILKYVLSASNIALIAYQCWIECIQMDSFSLEALKEHFGTVYNVLDVVQLISTFWITVANLQDGGSSLKDVHRVVAAFSLFIIWFKLFDWLRLWEETAFYIKLITQTIEDINVFAILFIVGLAMFGSGMFLLQNNREAGEPPLIPQIFDNFLLDLLLNQYMLSLGNFEHNYQDHPQYYLCWFFLIAATFFTSITLLNMLVAIMGNTFDMVLEKRQIYIMKSQLQTMSEYSDIITKYETDSQTYMFIVKQSGDGDGEDENDTWEGGFTFLRKKMYKEFMKLREDLCEKQGQQLIKLNDQIKSANEKTKEDQRESKGVMEKIKENMEEFQGDNKDVIDEMEALNTMMEASMQATIKAVNRANIGSKSLEELLEENVAHFAEWIRSLSPEEKAKLEAYIIAQIGEEGKAQRQAEFISNLGKVDTNKDVLLWRDEFNNLMNIYQEKRSSMDVPTRTMTDDQKLIWFAFFNAQTPGVEGVSITDFEKAFSSFQYAMAEEMKREVEENQKEEQKEE